jgi:hypothetical protein
MVQAQVSILAELTLEMEIYMFWNRKVATYGFIVYAEYMKPHITKDKNDLGSKLETIISN